MKLYTSILIIFISGFGFAFGQADTTRLLSEVEKKLSDHSLTAPGVLSESVYDKLHPQTSFRELIKKYAAPGVLTITNDNEPGKKIKVIATIKDKDDKPVANALVYLYQTDVRGWYSANAPHVLMNEGDYHHARLFGYGKTDKNGRLELHTIKPSGYPQSDLPAHIHVHIIAAGYRPLGTEFLFQDDERLKGEILNRAIVEGGIIAKSEAAETPFTQKFSYSITLRRE
jgi:protocatechuate 3,4-dioxygenase beta subunit